MKKKTNQGGRPEKYDPVFIDEVTVYLEEHKDEEIQLVKQAGENKSGGYEMFENKLKVKLPTIEGFARHIGVNKTTLYEWAAKYEAFSNALDVIRTEQQERLINSGLAGDYNSTIAKLILSSNHGMSEKTETDVTTKGESLNDGVTKILSKVYGQENA